MSNCISSVSRISSIQSQCAAFSKIDLKHLLAISPAEACQAASTSLCQVGGALPLAAVGEHVPSCFALPLCLCCSRQPC